MKTQEKSAKVSIGTNEEQRSHFVKRVRGAQEEVYRLRNRINNFRESISAYCVDRGGQSLKDPDEPEENKSDLDLAIDDLLVEIGDCHDRFSKLTNDFEG